MKFILEFGREPLLSAAEAESLLGKPEFLSDKFGVYVPGALRRVPFKRLGGSIRAAEVIEERDLIRFDDLLNNNLVQLDGVRDLGFSFIGTNFNFADIKKSALKFKRKAQENGIKLRLVLGPKLVLNAAQLKRNRLLGPGMEILYACSSGRCFVAKTVAIQDIDDYSKRDYGKPCADMKAGMMPPKLAQAAINLAVGPTDKAVIYDPFCGSGTVLSEGLLMGFEVWGSDIEGRMVECARKNLSWLASVYDLNEYKPDRVFAHDASKSYQALPLLDAVVTEGTLGPIFSKPPSKDRIDRVFAQIVPVHLELLHWVRSKLKPAGKVVLMLPLYDKQFPLKILDGASRLGYTHSRFSGLSYLAYRRPGQVTGRAVMLFQKS